MTIIGIDPALRKNGLAVCFLEDKVLSFKVYKEFYLFILDICTWQNSYKDINVIIEDSSKQNVTFNRGTSHRSALAISRNVGMNQAASIIITQLCKYYGFKTTLVSPKEKGAKWTENMMKLVLKQNEFITNNTKFTQDEIDSFTLAYILKTKTDERKSNNRWHKQ